MKLALPSCIDMGRNEDKYWLACQAEGQVFQPVPIEVLGGWHKDGVQVVKRVGQLDRRRMRWLGTSLGSSPFF